MHSYTKVALYERAKVAFVQCTEDVNVRPLCRQDNNSTY